MLGRVEDVLLSCDASMLAEHIVGRKILDYDSHRIVLDNGKILHLLEEECCAYFEASLKVEAGVELRGSLITKVTETQVEYGTHFLLNLISGNKNCAVVDVNGDPTSGYYITSFTLGISYPEQ